MNTFKTEYNLVLNQIVTFVQKKRKEGIKMSISNFSLSTFCEMVRETVGIYI